MKNVNLAVWALACGMLGSCTSELSEVMENELADEGREITFATGMNVGVSPWFPAGEIQDARSDASWVKNSRAPLSECASTIHFYDFVDGKMVLRKTEKTSGTFAAKLPYGEHSLRFVAHSSAEEPNDDATLFAPSAVTETFLCNQSLTVNDKTASAQTIRMKRVVAKVAVKILDAIPKGVTALKLSVGTHCAVLDLVKGEGVVSECKPYEKEWNIGNQLEGRVGQMVHALTFVPAEGITTTLKIEGKDASGKVLYMRETKNVPVEVNRVTTASCKLFKKESNFTFSIETDWVPGLEIDMEEQEVQ